jgi:RimJ/RimL family protein N-acetyltransferase
MEPPVLRTPRLILRPWREEDVEAFVALDGSPDVSRFAPAPPTPGESRALALGFAQALRDRGWGFWAVELRGRCPFVGFIGLDEATFPAPFTPCVEMGWRLAPQVWGQGLAPEGARATLDFAFQDLDLAEVVAFTSHRNLASMRVMEKLGMVRDPAGDFEHPHFPPGHPLRPHVLYRASRAPEG